MTAIDLSSIVRLSPQEFASLVFSLRPQVAVFDCDGTLWNGDAGYDFMMWSIEEGLVSRKSSDWIDSRYRLYRAGKVSEIAMCGEMVQIYNGLSESEVRNAAAVFFRTRIAPKIFPEMQSLVTLLASAGTEIWAVSSTNNWVIEEGVRGFNIPPARILAARVEVIDGAIGSRLLDVPSDEGKAIALSRAGIVAPDVVMGNSIHDAAMLQIARHPIPVNPTPGLLELAREKRWPVFFPDAVLSDMRG